MQFIWKIALAMLGVTASLFMTTPASAWVAAPAYLTDSTPELVQQVAKSTYSKYYANKAASRSAAIKASTRRSLIKADQRKAFYKLETKRYERKKAERKYEEKRYLAKKDAQKRHSAVRRGVYY